MKAGLLLSHVRARSPASETKPQKGRKMNGSKNTGSESKGLLDFKIDKYELRVLARHFLSEFLDDSVSSFATGVGGGSCEIAKEARYHEIAAYLEDHENKKVINEVEKELEVRHGDIWEVFKASCESSFFSSSPDVAALRREIGRLPKLEVDEEQFWMNVSNRYSARYAETLRREQ